MIILEQLVGGFRRSLLGASLLAAVACGTGSPSDRCWDNRDCGVEEACLYDEEKGARECVGSGEQAGEEPVCGNSPLTRKYLWQMSDCGHGMAQPFGRDCQGFFPWDNGDYPFTYQGNTLQFQRDSSEFGTTWDIFFQVREQDITREACNYGTGPYWVADRDQFLCTMSRLQELDPGFAGWRWKDKLCPNKEYIIYAGDEPWPGYRACRDDDQGPYETRERIERECGEQFPSPE